MKKIYLQPETTVTVVKLQSMIAESVDVTIDDKDEVEDLDEFGARPQWWVDPGL